MYRDKLFPLAALFWGVGGCYLNHQLHTLGVDSDTLLLSGSSYPTLLLILTGLVVAMMVAGVVRGTPHQGAEANLGSPSQMSIWLWRLGSSMLAVAAGQGVYAVIQQMSLRNQGYAVAIPYALMMAVVLGVVAAIGQLTVVKYLDQGQCPPKLGIMTTLVAFAPLPWLLYCYQENTKNPVVTLYGYQLVGLSAAAFALYLTATLFYGKSYPRLTALLSLVGGYLLITSACIDDPIYLSLSGVGLAMILLANAAVILKSLEADQHPQEKLENLENPDIIDGQDNTITNCNQID